jgi:CBS domain containing-hemolysin-like protein
MLPLVKFCMALLIPINYPIAALLDKILGHEGGSHFLFKRSELHALMDLHGDHLGGVVPKEQIAMVQFSID